LAEIDFVDAIDEQSASVLHEDHPRELRVLMIDGPNGQADTTDTVRLNLCWNSFYFVKEIRNSARCYGLNFLLVDWLPRTRRIVRPC